MPKQVRAKATVEVLLEATAQVLIRDGYAGLTTNHIAKRAGVSIGTLYQYFSSKEELVTALSEQLAEEQLAAFTVHLVVLSPKDMPLDEAVMTVLDGVFAMKRVRPELAHVLMTQVTDELGQPDLRQAWMRRCREAVVAVFYENRAEVRAADLELMSYVLVTSVFSLLEDASARRPELVRTDALRDELYELIVRYLRP